MAKRFIDTSLFDDSWFFELTKDAKLLFVYFITKCDHAGIIDVNHKKIEFETGIKSVQTVIEQLSNCLVTVKKNYLFMPKFIKYQYRQLNSAVSTHRSVINRLKDFDLLNENGTVKEQLPNCCQTVKDMDKDSSCSVVVVKSKDKVIKKSIHNNNNDNDIFNKFWEMYPRKVNKQGALKSFNRAKPPEDKLFSALKVQIEYWSGKDKEYIPHPTTYLNQSRWEDDLSEYKNGTGPGAAGLAKNISFGLRQILRAYHALKQPDIDYKEWEAQFSHLFIKDAERLLSLFKGKDRDVVDFLEIYDTGKKEAGKDWKLSWAVKDAVESKEDV